MRLYHGTGGERSVVESIFDKGLMPAPRPWAHEATGVESHVFACTTPIGTRGGDPIQFAQRRAWGKDARAWLIVIDVPDSLVHGAVPNDELERYWKARAFAASAFASTGELRVLVAAMRETRRSARELVRYRVVRTLEGLCDGEPDAHTLVQFEAAFMRASKKHKARVAASYGLRVPDWFLEDSHYPSCIGCMHQLFDVDLIVPDAGDARFERGAWDRLDTTTFGVFADILERWLAAAGDPPVRSLEDLQRAYPPPREVVPRVLWKDFVTADLATRMRAPDTQLLLGHVSPERIAGAIDLGTRDRLSNLVRPTGGETLLRKLEHLARGLDGGRLLD